MLLTVTGLSHGFHEESPLFEDLSFEADSGEVVALTGPSGSGKSTLLGILAGWTRPWSGSVRLDPPGNVVWVFQNPLGSPQRTALDHVTLPLLASGLDRREASRRAGNVMASFGLDGVADRRFSRLSGGEAQRLMLARAACTAGPLLLVDEPTAQLDRRSAETVTGVIRSLAAEGRAVVVATHDESLAAACTRQLSLSSRRSHEAQK